MEREREKERERIILFPSFFLRFGEEKKLVSVPCGFARSIWPDGGEGGRWSGRDFSFFPSCTRHLGGSQRGRLLPRGRWIKEECKKGARKESGGKKVHEWEGGEHAPHLHSRAVRELRTRRSSCIYIRVWPRQLPGSQVSVNHPN